MKYLVLLIFVFLPTTLLADFDKRKNEVMEEFKKLPMDDSMRSELQRTLEQYFRQRPQKLKRIHETISKREIDKTEQADEWKDEAQSGAKLVTDTIGKVEVDEPAEVDLFFMKITTEEHGFFTAIANSQMPVQRDVLAEKRQALKKQIEVLDDKWQDLSSKDNSNDRNMQDAAKELRELIDAQLENEARSRAEGLKKIANILNKVSKLNSNLIKAVKKLACAGAGLADPTLEDICDKLVDAFLVTKDNIKFKTEEWLIFDENVSKAKSEFTRAYQVESNILVMLRGTREDVKDFVKNHNIEAADKTVNEAMKAKSQMLSGAKTSGQKDDMNEFINKSKKHVEDIRGDFGSIYSEFIKEHETKFIGPLGDKEIEDLFEKNYYGEFQSQIQGSTISSFLTKRYSADEYFELTDDLQTGDVRELYDTLLKDDIEDLVEARNKAVAKTYDEILKEVIQKRNSYPDWVK